MRLDDPFGPPWLAATRAAMLRFDARRRWRVFQTLRTNQYYRTAGASNSSRTATATGAPQRPEPRSRPQWWSSFTERGTRSSGREL